MRPCAVFDLDGTLVNSLTDICGIIDEMLAERGSHRRIREADARPYASLGGKAMVAALLDEHAIDPDRDVADFRARYAAHATLPESLYPGVAEGLERLRATGLTLAVCSNKPQQLCDKVLGDLGLSSTFASIVGARDGVPLKPDPALLELTIRELGVRVSDCVYVGDSELDHASAVAVEMSCVLVTYGYGDLRGIDVSTPRADTFADAVGHVSAILMTDDKAARSMALASG